MVTVRREIQLPGKTEIEFDEWQECNAGKSRSRIVVVVCVFKMLFGQEARTKIECPVFIESCGRYPHIPRNS